MEYRGNHVNNCFIMKICIKCNINKEEIEFHKCGIYYQSYCKECKSIYGKLYRENNKESLAIKSKIKWGNKTKKEKENHNLSKKYVIVNCSTCNIEFNKRKDTIKLWGGLCQKCATKEVANRPEIKKNIT